MRYQGRVTEWHDSRGFGFISPNGGGDRVFLHISSVADRTSRPVPGSLFTYELERGKDGRSAAKEARPVLPIGVGQSAGPLV
jgi:cold shock CspA family protein